MADRSKTVQYIRFVAAFVVYLVIDVGWNFSPPAMAMYENFYDASGHTELLDAFGNQMDTLGGPEIIFALIFFGLIALGNSYLAIEPAVKARDLTKAMKNSLVLGLAAYATYSVPTFLILSTWPTALVPIDILIGGLLSFITSTSITWVTLRRMRS